MEDTDPHSPEYPTVFMRYIIVQIIIIIIIIITYDFKMAAAPRCQSHSNSRCCPCMKKGRCVRCRCVSRGTPCIDCWPSIVNPRCCENRQVRRALPAVEPVVSVDSAPIDPQPSIPSSDIPSIDFQEDIDSLVRLLSRPIKILKRIPRLSRVTVARKLAAVIEQVVSRNDVPSWVRLLHVLPQEVPLHPAKRWQTLAIGNPSQRANLSRVINHFTRNAGHSSRHFIEAS